MRTKTDALAGGYSEAEDHRYLSKQSLEKFYPPEYHKFVELVQDHSGELAFCFRGNSRDQGTAVIYYKNHVAFAISAKGDVTFDFDHARYMKDWRTQKAALEQYGYIFRKYNGPFHWTGKKYSIGTAAMAPEQAAALTRTQLEQLYTDHIKVMINCYFSANQKKECDHFREEVTGEKRIAKALKEKIAQQELFLTWKSPTGYFIYDMEFSQPQSELLECGNQPDLLAVRFNRDGAPERLVMIEVKSRKSALKGNSGVRPHVDGMEHYLDWLLPVRGRDAYHILEQYGKLGLPATLPAGCTEETFSKLPKEALMIFTGQDTITALGKEKAGGEETLDAFLLDKGYEPVCAEEFPQISLDGVHPEPMAVYRKDFGPAARG